MRMTVLDGICSCIDFPKDYTYRTSTSWPHQVSTEKPTKTQKHTFRDRLELSLSHNLQDTPPMGLPSECDVIVVGSGNAGFTAATAAVQSGAKRVILVDKCSSEWSGGSSWTSAGAFRAVYYCLEDLLPMVNNVDEETAAVVEMEQYTPRDFMADLSRSTRGRGDPALARILVDESNSTIKWLSRIGVQFQLSFNRQAYKVGDRHKFYGGLVLQTEDGGRGLIEDHTIIARGHGVGLFFNTGAKRILTSATGAVSGLVVMHEGQERVVRAKAVVLAAGGFSANPRMRSLYLGPAWDNVRVRGTPSNTGECIDMALRDVAAKEAGHWSGCHAVACDAAVPYSTDGMVEHTADLSTKSCYPLGLMVNMRGERFVDEGADLHTFTQCTHARAILAQPEAVAFQIFDSRTISWLRADEYGPKALGASAIMAQSVEELTDACAARGLTNRARFVETLVDYNRAAYRHRQESPGAYWDPSVRDGLSTQSRLLGMTPTKSNWALPVDQPPFLAVKVACGICGTFGGLAVKPETAGVLSTLSGTDIPGLFCAGDMMGGLFYGGCPSGCGLMAGAVFGRRAGIAAAMVATARRKIW